MTKIAASMLVLSCTSEAARADEDTTQKIVIEGSRNSQIGIVDAASAGVVTQKQLEARTVYRPGELLEATPERIIYLSCNPVTQARDVALLLDTYTITAHKGYNFFPRTPHIENLVILDLKS